MRLIFLGTPDFAVPTLRRLAIGRDLGRHVIAGVVSQPDRPSGRHGSLRAPAVKQAALSLGLEVYQPERLGAPAGLAWLRERQPEALVVVAFGQLLPPAVFDLPAHGALNAHASLLPLYRGAAPIQWAIAKGETRTGVSIMRIDAGLDTGPVLMQAAVEVGTCTTAPELAAELAGVAAELMDATLDRLARGAAVAEPQAAGATLAPRLRRADGQVDWRHTAAEIFDRWRGFQPWPGIHTRFRGRTLAILRCQPAAPGLGPETPGALAATPGEGLLCGCGRGSLWLDALQPEGRQPMSAAAFAHGARLTATDRFE